MRVPVWPFKAEKDERSIAQCSSHAHNDDGEVAEPLRSVEHDLCSKKSDRRSCASLYVSASETVNRKTSHYHFWARGYYVSTVGLAEEVIREYIRKQEADEKKQEKLELG